MALEWFVQTFDPQTQRFLSEFETWHNRDEQDARTEFMEDRRIPQFAERRLMSYGVHPGDAVPEARLVESRIVTRFLSGPVLLHGSTRRAIRAWSAQGDAIATLLMQPDDYTTNERANYVMFEDGMVSYLQAGRTHVIDDDGNWLPENRMKVKAGKGIRTILTESALRRITDKDIEDFANRVKAIEVLESGTVHVVRGEAIKTWYHKSSGKVSSCMSHDHAQAYLNGYAANPDKVGLAILLDTNSDMIGRALVWNLDDGRVFMDRIYGNDTAIRAFKNYANDNGWLHRLVQSYESPDRIVNAHGLETDENVLFCTWQHNIDPYSDRFPYMDTMIYLNAPTGRLTNNSEYRHTHYLRSQDGNCSSVRPRRFPLDGDPPPRFDPWGGELGPDDPMPTHRCYHCHTRMVEGVNPMVTVTAHGADQTYCAGCGNLQTRVCEQCGVRKSRDEYAVEWSQPGDVCIACHRAGQGQCTLCRNWVAEDDLRSVDTTGDGTSTQVWCPDCHARGRECSGGHLASAGNFPTIRTERFDDYGDRIYDHMPLCWSCWDRFCEGPSYPTRDEREAFLRTHGLTDEMIVAMIGEPPIEVDDDDEPDDDLYLVDVDDEDDDDY